MTNKPAAHISASTSHGTPLIGQGSPNVFIGKMSAWRANVDMHSCPLFNGPVPHVGGVVLKGSSKVFINKFPAVRVGDTIQESGVTNQIVSGNSTVLISD